MPNYWKMEWVDRLVTLGRTVHIMRADHYTVEYMKDGIRMSDRYTYPVRSKDLIAPLIIYDEYAEENKDA